MKLIKHKEGYSLCIEENGSNSREFIATTDGMYVKHRLSKQNCDEIFGVVDVEKLVYEEYLKFDQETRIVNRRQLQESLANMFNKAMELNKDKLFTVEDMVGYFDWHKKQGYVSHEPYDIHEYIQSLQQPTEIEVEIEMDDIWDGIDSARIFPKEETMIPKLDENGCLILKKK
jgi:hypothetical protein